MGVYYRSLSQDDDTNVLSYKELREICRSLALILTVDFSFSDFNWDYHTTDMNKSRKSVKHAEGNILIQVLRELGRKGWLSRPVICQ